MRQRNIYRIAPAQKRDFEDWVKMRKRIWPSAGKKDLKETYAAILKSRKATAFFCRKGAIPVGFVHVTLRYDWVDGSTTSPVGYLEEVFVNEEERKEGVARMLVLEAERWVAKRGCKEMGSDTELSNKSSQKFHKALGFREVERSVVFIKRI